MKKANYSLVKLALCGPNDVEHEIKMAAEIIDKWNIQNGDARGFWVRHFHWQTDVYPNIATRTQEVPNRQIIDPANILVAVFWSRFGTPTGVAESGTKEEILRAVNQGKKVMVYFSDLEPKPSNADQVQLDNLWQFRQEIRQRGICFNFSLIMPYALERNSRSYRFRVFSELWEHKLAMACCQVRLTALGSA